MAENEYLDSSKAARWQSVVQAIRRGGSIGEVVERVEDCLFKTLRQIRTELPFAEMLQAMHDPDELLRLRVWNSMSLALERSMHLFWRAWKDHKQPGVLIRLSCGRCLNY